MKSLNIAYFLSERIDYLGGADHTLFMQALLMNSYHNITVVIPCDLNGRFNNKFRSLCEEFGLCYEILTYSRSYCIRTINMVDYNCDIVNIEQFVLENNIDVLHSVQINLAVEYISRKYHIPHVMNIYSLQDWEWSIPPADIFPQYISSDSEFFLEKWKTYLGSEGECVRIFDDIGIQKKWTKNDETIILGAAGIVCEYKNQFELIKAVEIEIKKGRDVQLIIAGCDNSAYACRCKNYIEENNLQARIRFLGFVDDMKSFFEETDVFICGSTRESFPATVVEAISCNMPVISTPVAGVPEILIDRENAYLSKDCSAGELAEAIENFFEDYGKGRLLDILANEKTVYDQYFSGDAVKEQLTKLYDRMLKFPVKIGKMQEWLNIEDKLAHILKKVDRFDLEESEKEFIHNRLLYFLQIRYKISAKYCYIWGAGKWGKLTKLILENIIGNINIRNFVDEKKEGMFEGIDVITKEEMDLQEDVAVFIGFALGQETAIEYLENRNMKLFDNVFIIP